jgi:hypothetical protein
MLDDPLSSEGKCPQNDAEAAAICCDEVSLPCDSNTGMAGARMLRVGGAVPARRAGGGG